MTEVSQELVERMVALVRSMSPLFMQVKSSLYADRDIAFFQEAVQIDALLPEPVDPDWKVAREVFIERHCAEIVRSDERVEIRQGHWDDRPLLQTVFTAIKRGRELAASASA